MNKRNARSLVGGGLLIFTVLLGVARHGAAEPPKPAERGDDFTSYEFDDDKVLGDNTQPSIEEISILHRAGRESLIRVRENFIPELYKSVEAL